MLREGTGAAGVPRSLLPAAPAPGPRRLLWRPRWRGSPGMARAAPCAAPRSVLGAQHTARFLPPRARRLQPCGHHSVAGITGRWRCWRARAPRNPRQHFYPCPPVPPLQPVRHGGRPRRRGQSLWTRRRGPRGQPTHSSDTDSADRAAPSRGPAPSSLSPRFQGFWGNGARCPCLSGSSEREGGEGREGPGEIHPPPGGQTRGQDPRRTCPRPAQTRVPVPKWGERAQAPRAVGTVWAWHELSVTGAWVWGHHASHPLGAQRSSSQQNSPRPLVARQLVSVWEVPGHGGI